MKQDKRQQEAYRLAIKHLGLKEIPGAIHEEEIVKMFAAVGHSWVKDDETAWCAAFAGAMLEWSGLPSTRKLTARSYLEWGQPVAVESILPGDVLVWPRGNSSWQGHVGFAAEAHKPGKKEIKLLGGNQKNMVRVDYYPLATMLAGGARRWPAAEEPSPLAALIEAILSIFRGAK